MFRFVSSIGSAAYNAASTTGITARADQPPYPCATPLFEIRRPIDASMTAASHEAIEGFLDDTYAAARDMLSADSPMLQQYYASMGMSGMHGGSEGSPSSLWSPVRFSDPDHNGDLQLFTCPHIGPYHLTKATMCFRNVCPEQFFEEVHGQNIECRKRCTANLKDYRVLARNPAMDATPYLRDDRALQTLARRNAAAKHTSTSSSGAAVSAARPLLRNWHVEMNQFSAPPPVSCREVVFLVEKRYVPEEDTYYIYGCSVDYSGGYENKTNCVRALCLFGWELCAVNGNTTARMVQVMNPSGWTPSFVLSWFKSEIAKELVGTRRAFYAAVQLDKDGTSKLGVEGHGNMTGSSRSTYELTNSAGSATSYTAGSSSDGTCTETEDESEYILGEGEDGSTPDGKLVTVLPQRGSLPASSFATPALPSKGKGVSRAPRAARAQCQQEDSRVRYQEEEERLLGYGLEEELVFL